MKKKKKMKRNLKKKTLKNIHLKKGNRKSNFLLDARQTLIT